MKEDDIKYEPLNIQSLVYVNHIYRMNENPAVFMP